MCAPAARRTTKKPRIRFRWTAASEADAAAAAATVRGLMIAWLDGAYLEGELGAVLFRDAEDLELRQHGLDVFQQIQLVLFPEEFGEPERGLMPDRGPARCGAARLLTFAAVLANGAG